MKPLNRIELDAVLDMDKPMPPDERLSRALGVIGLMGWQLKRALDEGGVCGEYSDELIDMVARDLERARKAKRERAA